MGKFILVTFGFMGFVFYEVSGGDDFIPLADEKRAVIAEAKAAKEKASSTVIAVAETAAEPEQSEQIVADLVVASLSTQGSTNITPTPEPVIQNAVQTAVLEIEAEPTPDMREVTSARVNMRSGPGQNFDVISKLTAGNQVEILQDPGDGWVKLRVVDNGRVGWMADFLLTASN